MINIKNLGYQEYKNYIKNKKICIWGAGRALESCLDIYFTDKDIEIIVDANESLWGTYVSHNGKQIPIVNVNTLINYVSSVDDASEISLMITSPFYASEIVEQIDKIDALDGLEVCLQVLIRNKKEYIPDYEFTCGEEIIPKIIHYIWVGNKELPDEYKKNIESWRKHNPDYEIKCWNEKNYDFSKCDYMREAYEKKAWGFVPNYARLDIVNQYGGIYLDTDVEAVKNFDCILKDEAFFNMGCADRINQGCGFGAVKNSLIISDMMKQFEQSHFIDEKGNEKRTPCHVFINPVLKKYGFDIINKYQCINNIALYPCEVMSPKTIKGMEDFTSYRTLSVHKEYGTWKNEKEKNGILALEKMIQDRLYE